MKKKLLLILFYIYITGIVIFIFLGPDVKSVGGRISESIDKACLTNVHKLSNAVNMYNMDFDSKMTTLDQKILRENKYLTYIDDIKCPLTESDGTYFGTNLTGNGVIICSYHGFPYEIFPGEKTEIPKVIKSKKQLEFERKLYQNNCYRRLPYAFLWPLFSRKNGLTTYYK